MKVSHFIDYEYFLKGFAVECFDTEHHCVIYLFVALSNSCIYDLACRKTAAVRMKHFIAAHAVCTEALGTDVLQQPSFYIGLYRVMYFYVVRSG